MCSDVGLRFHLCYSVALTWESDLSCLSSFLHPKIEQKDAQLFVVRIKYDFICETLSTVFGLL